MHHCSVARHVILFGVLLCFMTTMHFIRRFGAGDVLRNCRFIFMPLRGVIFPDGVCAYPRKGVRFPFLTLSANGCSPVERHEERMVDSSIQVRRSHTPPWKQNHLEPRCLGTRSQWHNYSAFDNTAYSKAKAMFSEKSKVRSLNTNRFVECSELATLHSDCLRERAVAPSSSAVNLSIVHHGTLTRCGGWRTGHFAV